MSSLPDQPAGTSQQRQISPDGDAYRLALANRTEAEIVLCEADCYYCLGPETD